MVPQHVRFLSFNSRPHKEVDPGEKCDCQDRKALSIHDLTRRSTLDDADAEGLTIFQFTTSQGGRREYYSSEYDRIELSIHDLTRRSTR